jgi:site-specific DNA recombinase
MEIVKLVFQKYMEFESLSQVHKYLLSNNIKTKQGCDWGKKQIQLILTNPVYVKANDAVFDYLTSQSITAVGTPNGKHGLLTYNKKQGRKTYRDTDEWIAAVSKHEGVIDADKWLKIQTTLQVNKDKAPRLGKTHTALLTGIIKCAKCGSGMRVAYGNTDPITGKKTYYYTCTMKNASGGSRCNNKNVRGDLIEKVVMEKLKEATADTGMILQELMQ